MRSMLSVITKSIESFLRTTKEADKDNDFKNIIGVCFGLLINPDNTEEYYIGTFPQILNDAMSEMKENSFCGSGKEGDFLLNCLDFPNKDCILNIFGFPKDEFENGYADALISKLEHSEDCLTRFMDSYFSECREKCIYPDLKAFENNFGAFGFGYTQTSADLNDAEAINATYSSVIYLKEMRDQLKQSINNSANNEYTKFAREKIDDIDATLESKGKSIEDDIYFENKNLIDSYQARENNYIDGVIGYWYSNKLDATGELTICGERKLMIANMLELNSVISFAVRNAVKNKKYIKKCSYCKKYIYTATKRYPHFCGDECRKAYHTDYSRHHQKSYKKLKLMDRDYENLRKYVRRHISSANDDNVLKKLNVILRELSEEGVLRKNAANLNEKYNPEWEGSPQEEFYAYDKQIRERVKEVEGGKN